MFLSIFYLAIFDSWSLNTVEQISLKRLKILEHFLDKICLYVRDQLFDIKEKGMAPKIPKYSVFLSFSFVKNEGHLNWSKLKFTVRSSSVFPQV